MIRCKLVFVSKDQVINKVISETISWYMAISDVFIDGSKEIVNMVSDIKFADEDIKKIFISMEEIR